MDKYKKIGLIFITLALIFIVIFYNKVNNSEHKITIGIQTSPAMATVMVAKNMGFFKKQGLNVELKEFTAGKFALAAFLARSLDYSISADVPVTLATLSGNKIIVPAQVVKKTINEVRVVVNNENKNLNQEEYFKSKKRKLATSIGAGPEFFTYEFLNSIGIKNDEIEIISQNPKDMPISLISGSVDAIAIYDPFAFFAEKGLGSLATTYTNGNIYSELYLLEANENVLKDDYEIKKILQALIEAENFIKTNPKESKEIVMIYTGLNMETIDAIWSSYDFSIALTKQLLENFKKETDWAKKTGKVKLDSEIPDFNQVIYTKALKDLDATRVDL